MYKAGPCNPTFLEERFCSCSPLIATSSIRRGQSALSSQKPFKSRLHGTLSHYTHSSLQSVTPTHNAYLQRQQRYTLFFSANWPKQKPKLLRFLRTYQPYGSPPVCFWEEPKSFAAREKFRQEKGIACIRMSFKGRPSVNRSDNMQRSRGAARNISSPSTSSDSNQTLTYAQRMYQGALTNKMLSSSENKRHVVELRHERVVVRHFASSCPRNPARWNTEILETRQRPSRGTVSCFRGGTKLMERTSAHSFSLKAPYQQFFQSSF